MNKKLLRERAQAMAAQIFTPFYWEGVGAVVVKSLTEPELLKVSKSFSKDKGDFSAFLLAATVHDADHEPLYNIADPDDYAFLVELKAVGKRKLVEFAARLNGLGSDAGEAALGNSQKPGESAGASPLPSDTAPQD